MNKSEAPNNVPFANLSDKELIEKYKQNEDKNIVGEFYERYQHLAYGVCLKYLQDPEEAKEAVLQVFSTLYTSLYKYDINEFKGWFHTIVRNHCLHILKAGNKTVSIAEHHEKNISIDFMENEVAINHIKHKEQIFDELDKALKTLKPAQEQCIRLFYLENKSYQEIVSITNFELKKVKSYIQNGKRNLQIKLQHKI